MLVYNSYVQKYMNIFAKSWSGGNLPNHKHNWIKTTLAISDDQVYVSLTHIQTCHALYFLLHNINSVTGRINIIVIVPSHLMSSILFLILVKYASRPSHLANLTNLPVSFLLPTSQPQTFISCSGLFISTLRLHRYCYKVSHLCSLQPSFRWLSHGHERQRPTTTKRRHISSHKEMRATQNIRHAFWAVGLDFAL
jgi:hypothetical protein